MKRVIKPSLKVRENNAVFTPTNIRKITDDERSNIIKSIVDRNKPKTKTSVKAPVNTLDLTKKKVGDDDDAEPVDIYDPDNRFYKKYFNNPDDALKKMFYDVVEVYEDRLPYSYFNDLALFELKTPLTNLKPVLFSKLINGDYHTETSKSDKNIASNIKSFTNNLPSFKIYKDIDNLSWIIEKHRLLFVEMVLYHIRLNHSVASIKTAITAILRIIFLATGKKQSSPLYVKYSTIQNDTGKKITENEGDNRLSANEQTRYIDWTIVLKEQQDLYNKFNAISNKKTVNAYDTNQDLLLISLYSLIPPLRAEPKTLRFTDKIQNKGDWVLFDGDDVYLDLHEVKKKHYDIKLKCPDNLAKILRESYDLYPRDAVFTAKAKYPDVSKKVSIGTMDDRLKYLFLKYGVNVGSSILRSSYITYIFNNKKLSYNEKEEIARKMRTSREYLELNYYKIIMDAIPINDVPVANNNKKVSVAVRVPNNKKVSVAVPVPNNKVSVAVPVPNNKNNVKNAYERQLERNTKYYDANKEKVLEKQRANKSANKDKNNRVKILYLLNNDSGYRNKIRETTYSKYKIQYSDGVYS